jgi:hypothetical protein
MSDEIKMSNFKTPQSATHFIEENDEYRAHFIQTDEVGSVFAEFVPSVNYIGWDFDIEPYPMPVNAIPVSACRELATLRQQNAELFSKIELNTKILNAICDRKPLQGSDYHAINCTVKNNVILLSKIKGEQDAKTTTNQRSYGEDGHTNDQ